MAGLAAARMSGGSEFQHARRRVLRTWFVAMASLTCCWKPIAYQYMLLRCWTYGWYAGHLPVCIPYMIVHSLKSIRQWIGSQCSTIRLGVTWSRTSSWWTRRAAAFWTRCSGSSVDCGTPASTALSQGTRRERSSNGLLRSGNTSQCSSERFGNPFQTWVGFRRKTVGRRGRPLK